MKKSIYNIYVKNKDKYILFNSLTSACVILSIDEFKNYNALTCDESFKNELIRMGFYVNDNLNEVDYLLARNRLVYESTRVLSLRIFTTTLCNAKCYYCYEKGINPIQMSYETADDIISFISDKISYYKSLNIQWFGGEPLMNYGIIDYIIERINPLLEKHNVSLKSTMISNGYLFNDVIINKAKNLWNLKQVQITLDGLKDTYQRIKKINDINAFDKVISNIKLLAKHEIKVSIRLNYSSENFDEIIELIEFLSKNIEEKSFVRVYAKRLFEESDKDETTKMDKKIFKHLIRTGFTKNNINLNKPVYLPCMANNINNLIINADGSILKCSRAINSEYGIIGHIKNFKPNPNISIWCSSTLDKKCLKCQLLPLCAGGCRMERLLNSNPCLVEKEILKLKLKNILKENL